VAPSRKVTVPVAEVGDIVAVNVTDCPEAEGLPLEVTTAVVMALLALTVCKTTPETLLVSLLSPL
jgi:hypothetical protein